MSIPNEFTTAACKDRTVEVQNELKGKSQAPEFYAELSTLRDDAANSCNITALQAAESPLKRSQALLNLALYRDYRYSKARGYYMRIKGQQSSMRSLYETARTLMLAENLSS